MTDAQYLSLVYALEEMNEFALTNQWIPVDKELPAKNERVICSNGLDLMLGIITDDLECDSGDGTLLCGVEYWMHIPETPNSSKKTK